MSLRSTSAMRSTTGAPPRPALGVLLLDKFEELLLGEEIVPPARAHRGALGLHLVDLEFFRPIIRRLALEAVGRRLHGRSGRWCRGRLRRLESRLPPEKRDPHGDPPAARASRRLRAPV